jgi:hypothetical protein
MRVLLIQFSLVAQGGVELLVSALAQHPADLRVQRAVCRAVWKTSDYLPVKVHLIMMNV